MKTLIFTLFLLNLSILSVNANDALLDNIANSGARNFETIRKGWAPTQEEMYSRRLMELRIQQQEQEIRRNEYQRRRLQELEVQRRNQ